MQESDQTHTELLLDKIDAIRILRADTDEERDKLLLEIGGSGKVEQEMVAQLSSNITLRHPQRFEEAHCLMVHGLEVLDRNGPRQPHIRGLGPLSPIAQWFSQQAIRFIVRSYQEKVLKHVCGLYERREASCSWSSPEHSLLRRSRLDIRRVKDGMNNRAIDLPIFIFGGAVLTTLGSGLQGSIRIARNSEIGVILFAILLVAVLFSLSWIALLSAGVARRRIKIAIEQPLFALWETIGHAGRPPRDDSYNFAAYAIILLVLSWIIVPLAIGMVIFS